MDFWEVVEARHSTREFSPAPVHPARIRRLLDAAAAAPSAMNSQPWRYYVATGDARHRVGEIIAGATVHLQEYMEQLGPRHYEDAVSWYSSLGGAPVLIGVTMPIPESDADNLNKLLSVGASIENLLLAAVSLGLAACNITFTSWVREELEEFLGVPADRMLVAVVALGDPGPVPPVAPDHDEDIAEWIE